VCFFVLGLTVVTEIISEVAAAAAEIWYDFLLVQRSVLKPSIMHVTGMTRLKSARHIFVWRRNIIQIKTPTAGLVYILFFASGSQHYTFLPVCHSE